MANSRPKRDPILPGGRRRTYKRKPVAGSKRPKRRRPVVGTVKHQSEIRPDIHKRFLGVVARADQRYRDDMDHIRALPNPSYEWVGTGTATVGHFNPAIR